MTALAQCEAEPKNPCNKVKQNKYLGMKGRYVSDIVFCCQLYLFFLQIVQIVAR